MSLNNIRRVRLAARETARELRKRTTLAETLFWEAVRRRRILGYKFLRQYPILHDMTGRETFYVADFYCAKLRLAIELDGDIHDSQKEADQRRDEILTLQDITVLRLRNQDVEEQLENVLRELAKTIHQREDQLAQNRKKSSDLPPPSS